MLTENTNSTIFMVPPLRIGRNHLKNNNFINAFSIDKQREIQYPDSVYLLFKPKSLDRFKLFVDEEYIRTKKLIDDYDYVKGHTVLVYTLPQEFKEDFDKVRQGKYSKTSDEFQQLFPKKVELYDEKGLQKDEISLYWRIFKKTNDLKLFWESDEQWGSGVKFTDEMEVWPIWNNEKETLDIAKIV